MRGFPHSAHGRKKPARGGLFVRPKRLDRARHLRLECFAQQIQAFGQMRPSFLVARLAHGALDAGHQLLRVHSLQRLGVRRWWEPVWSACSPSDAHVRVTNCGAAVDVSSLGEFTPNRALHRVVDFRQSHRLFGIRHLRRRIEHARAPRRRTSGDPARRVAGPTPRR